MESCLAASPRVTALARAFARSSRMAAIGALTVMLVACGGGGGGGSDDGGGGGGTSGRGNLTVRVLDDRSNAVASATVNVNASGTTRSGTTGADGNAAFTDLPAGSASVEATKTNYIPATSTASVPNGGTNTVSTRITRRSGSVAVTVLDAFDTPVPNAAVQVSSDGIAQTGTTPAAGVVTIASVPTGDASVAVTASGFKATPAQTATVNEGQTSAVTVRLERITQAAGGFVTARVETGGLSADGKTLSFNIQVIVINELGQAVENPDLTAAAFALLPCTDSTTTAFECVRGSQQSNDASYTVLTPTPLNHSKVLGQPRVPYLAALLLDQSRSVGQQSDPTDARIFATKTFLDTQGIAGDSYALSAFASDADAGNGGPALIPTKPVTDYGSSNNGRDFFDELDALANLEGGATPLYAGVRTSRSPTPEPRRRPAAEPWCCSRMARIRPARLR